ncbi:ATP-binding protein [Clostridiaceae bacterium 35-E11]
MKSGIKKKIILPLFFLMIMPIFVLGGLSFWNDYKLIQNNEIMHVDTILNDLLILLENIDYPIDQKGFVLNYIKSMDKENMFIIEKDKFVYYHIQNEDIDVDQIRKAIKQDTQILQRYILRYRVYRQWDWKIGFLIDKKQIPSRTYAINAYLTLLIPLFILFSLGAITVITENFSKPIEILLDGYKHMLTGNFKTKINIERKDELGLLGHAFNDMKNEIADRTNKFIQMKNFNEDILRSIATGIITTNVAGKVIKYNQAAVEIIEKTTQSKESHPAIVKVLLKQIMNTLQTEKTMNCIESFLSKEEGKSIYLDITTALMKKEDGTTIGVICSFNDISNRKRIEDKIERINRLTSLGQLTAALAHEIRNPLAGMKMSAQVLKKRLCKHLSTTDEKLFDATIHEIDRLNDLITDLLDFSKPHLPKIQVVNVDEVLENALQFSNKIISQKQISVRKEYWKASVSVYFDKGQLAQVFLNLISNAVKAMDAQGILRIRMEPIEETERIRIIFEDNGCGIEKENLYKIFDPFYTTSESGTGLGLSVVHKLITANNGEIDVESQIRKGTKIKLCIPLYRRDEDEEKSTDY